MSIRGWAVFWVALGLMMTGLSGRAEQATIPKAEGTTLTGKAIVLPEAMKSKVGVLVLGFSHGSQEQVAAWGRRLAADYAQSKDVVYFEVPILAGAPKILRGMIVKKMASSVPKVERPHFLPLTENEAGWRTVAHFSKPDDAYVLVIDGNGSVLWQTEGDTTDATYRRLKEKLAAVSGASNAR
jgi:hypothetical protein